MVAFGVLNPQVSDECTLDLHVSLDSSRTSTEAEKRAGRIDSEYVLESIKGGTITIFGRFPPSLILTLSFNLNLKPSIKLPSHELLTTFTT
jgi:hypothetical protein